MNWPGLAMGKKFDTQSFHSTTVAAGDELAFAEEAPSEYGNDDVEDEDTSLNKVPSPKRLLKNIDENEKIINRCLLIDGQMRL